MKKNITPKSLREAFTTMICTGSIYKQLGCSSAYPGVIRADMRRGIWPKETTMRELLEKAGGVQSDTEKWIYPPAKITEKK